MTDDDTENAGASARSQRWPVWRRRAWLAAAIAVVMAAGAVWLVFALTGSGSDSGGHPESPTEVDPGSVVLPGRKYSDEQLGLNQLIDEEITPFHASFRSFSDWEGPYDERNSFLEQEAVGHERERIYFERNVAWLLSNAYDDLPADLGFGGLLDQAFEEALSECADAAGSPGLKLNISSEADIDQALEVSGLTYEGFLDLRYECSKQAATYPTLDPAVRDELLDRLRAHYRAAVHEYLREFPDAEVPLVDHPGARRPLEERLIDTCLKGPDPVPCAQDYRVELPAE
ncbi:MAG: hypothetical protein F4190_14720 [Acidimicrobiales bacterium]|nr:hypothetical protein [Acidimicrobiales bacterium]MYG89760.1 hypothetical protein [Acidimicrobiales bacterium]MYI27121.1 hypothetical protein [Acidimicrobiales bacterium]